MKSSQDILSSVVKTTQMGQTGIRAVLDYAENIELKQALLDQLNEYNAIEKEAQHLASQRGWRLETLGPIAKSMSVMYSKVNLKFGEADSKIAAMMIQGNTRGLIKGLKNLHLGQSVDCTLRQLSQKLLDCEAANMQQMQRFL